MAVDVDERTLYVANLHKNVTEDILYELFLQAGPIERVSIPNTGNKTFRYGFVTYIHKCAIDYAIELYKGTCLFKTEILVKRKGEKSGCDKQLNNSDRCSNDRMNEHDIRQNHSMDYGRSYSLDYHQSPNVGRRNRYKSNNHNSKLVHDSLAGRRSDRRKPYDRDSRRNYSSRSNNSRSRYRNRDSDYDNSYSRRY